MNTGSEDRVLVVEEPDGREMLKLGLEMAGYRVDLAVACRGAAMHAGQSDYARRRDESGRAHRARAEPDRGIR